MSIESDSFTDETVETRVSPSAQNNSYPPFPSVEPSGRPEQSSRSQDETVKINAPASAEPPAPSTETQPTVRVEARPISETQPTMPMAPRAFQPSTLPPAPGGGEPPPFIRRGARNLPISGWTLIAIAAVGVLLVLFAIGLYVSSKGGVFVSNTPTPTATFTPVVTATPQHSPTPTLRPTNTPVPPTFTPVLPTNTPRPAPTELGVGVLAQVTPPEGAKLKVRAQAGIDGELLGELEKGAQVKIIEGPAQASNLKWWKIDNGQGLVGWSAEGVGSDVYLTLVGWAP